MPQMPFNPFSSTTKMTAPTTSSAWLALQPWSMPFGGTLRIAVRGAFDVFLGWGPDQATAQTMAQGATAMPFFGGSAEGVSMPGNAAFIAVQAPDGASDVHVTQGQFG